MIYKILLTFFLTILWQGTLPADLVDIGAGRKIYVECQGKGSPTVILISGRSDRASIWEPVISQVSTFAHVCAYDRPGTVTIKNDSVIASRSTSVPQPTTPKDAVADLHALVATAKIPGPYVLVAHSYGGLIARLYASIYPNEVVGLVMVDTLTDQLYDALTPQQQALWIKLNSNYSEDLDRYTIQERTDFPSTFNQMHSTHTLRQMPAIVLTSDEPYDFRPMVEKGLIPKDAPLEFAPVLFQINLKAQEKLAQSLHAKHITKTHAGHYIHTEQPQMVIDAIREVVEKVRALSASHSQ